MASTAGVLSHDLHLLQGMDKRFFFKKSKEGSHPATPLLTIQLPISHLVWTWYPSQHPWFAHLCSFHFWWQLARFNWFPWLVPSHLFYFYTSCTVCVRGSIIKINLSFLALSSFFSTDDNMHKSKQCSPLYLIKDWCLICISYLSSTYAVILSHVHLSALRTQIPRIHSGL